MPSLQELANALVRMHAREAKVLSERLLVPRTRAEAAAYWAVPVASADVMLLRAGRALEAALANTAAARPLEFGLEASQAKALGDALDGATAAAEIAALAELCRQTRDHREPISQALRHFQEQEEKSPRRQAETWARRGAIALVVGLTAFFLWREQHKPRFEPRPPPREHPR